MRGFTGEYDSRDVLLKAVSLVEERWTQGAWFRIDDRILAKDEALALADLEAMRVCALGALTLTAHRLGASEKALRGARARLGRWISKTFGSAVATFNDAEDRTAEQVADTLRRAAE